MHLALTITSTTYNINVTSLNESALTNKILIICKKSWLYKLG